MSRGGARGQALAAAALFSVGGALIKATDFSAFQVAGFRSAVAVVTLVAAGWLWPALRPRLTRRGAWVAIPYAATMLLFVLGNKMTTAAHVVFLHNTAPLYLLALGPWLLGERWTRRDLPYMGALALGLVLCVSAGGEVAGSAELAAQGGGADLGNWIAAATGLAWACTVLGLRWLAAGREASEEGGSSALGAVLAGNLLTCAVALPFAVPVVEPTATDWAVVVFLGAFQIAVAYFFLTAAVRRLPALEISLLLLLEPVLSPIWAWWLHAEKPGAWALVGGGVILLATAVRALSESRAGSAQPV